MIKNHISRIPFGDKKSATLFVFGDRQQGSSGYRREAWKAFEAEFKSVPGAMALGLGDYGDWLRPSLRPAVDSALRKDDSAREMLDNDIKRSHDAIIDEMSFLEGKLIGLHEGHHNWNFANGENTDQRLASALRAPYLGWIAATRLVLEQRRKTSRDSRDGGYVWTIVSTHGNANGRRVPSALSWLETNIASAFVADQYIGGHGCKSANEAPFKRMAVRRKGPAGIESTIPRIMSVGGFAEGYTDGWKSDYVERAGFSPQPISWGRIDFKLVQSIKENRRLGLERQPGAKMHKYVSETLDVNNVNRFFLDDPV